MATMNSFSYILNDWVTFIQQMIQAVHQVIKLTGVSCIVNYKLSGKSATSLQFSSSASFLLSISSELCRIIILVYMGTLRKKNFLVKDCFLGVLLLLFSILEV